MKLGLRLYPTSITLGAGRRVDPMPIPASKLRPPVKTHGGKAYLARWIVGLLPPHRVYVEPFLGGGSVVLNKPRCEVEVAGDVDADLVNLWRCLQDPAGELIRLARELPYDAATFAEAGRWLASTDPLLRALGTLVRRRFSRGGLGEDFAWSDRLRGGQPGDVNAWQTFVEGELTRIAERARGVRLECGPAARTIAAHDAEGAVIYCDPPYLHSTRTARKAYAHEMTELDHRELLDQLLGCRARVVISGYRCPMYDAALAGWERHDIPIANHSGQGKVKGRRVESVWVSPHR
jgi:DNA adenine methylase